MTPCFYFCMSFIKSYIPYHFLKKYKYKNRPFLWLVEKYLIRILLSNTAFAFLSFDSVLTTLVGIFSLGVLLDRFLPHC